MDSQIFGVYQPAALIPFDAQIAPSLANQWRPLHTDPVSFFFLKEFLYFYYLFIFSCVGSSFLCKGFL